METHFLELRSAYLHCFSHHKFKFGASKYIFLEKFHTIYATKVFQEKFKAFKKFKLGVW